jgi:putative hydrolase of the HAD superfamily
MPPTFIYFDLGQVVVRFDRQRQYRQMAAVAGVSPEQVRDVFAEHDLQNRYETGSLTSREVHECFCQATGASCDFDQLRRAGSDIFWLNYSLLPVIGGLWSAGYRLGILSNTCQSHWQHCTDGRFTVLTEYFATAVLSYEVRAMKPDERIYAAAATAADVAPEEIFYTDDIEEHIGAARQFGFDAEIYVGTPDLVNQLRQRGIRFNY